LIGSLLRLAMHFFQAGVAVDGRRREVAGAVQGEQVASLIEDKRLQCFSALELAQDRVEQGSYRLRLHGVEDLPHVRVRRNARDAEQVPHVLVIAALFECQQGRVFQRKHAESRHERVRQGNRALPPAMVRDLIKFQPQECVQRIGREMLALRRSALFWRRRQDHDDSSHPVPNYHPGWQTAILPLLRWTIYRCSLLYEASCRFPPFRPLSPSAGTADTLTVCDVRHSVASGNDQYHTQYLPKPSA